MSVKKVSLKDIMATHKRNGQEVEGEKGKPTMVRV